VAILAHIHEKIFLLHGVMSPFMFSQQSSILCTVWS